MEKEERGLTAEPAYGRPVAHVRMSTLAIGLGRIPASAEIRENSKLAPAIQEAGDLTHADFFLGTQRSRVVAADEENAFTCRRQAHISIGSAGVCGEH